MSPRQMIVALTFMKGNEIDVYTRKMRQDESLDMEGHPLHVNNNADFLGYDLFKTE